MRYQIFTVVVVSNLFTLNELHGAHVLGSLLKRATGDFKDSEGNSGCLVHHHHHHILFPSQ